MCTCVCACVHIFIYFLFAVDASVKDQKPQSSGTERQFSTSLLSDIKMAVGAEKTNQLFVALQTYKKTNDYEQMVSTVVGLLTERDEDIILLKSGSLCFSEEITGAWVLVTIFYTDGYLRNCFIVF